MRLLSAMAKARLPVCGRVCLHRRHQLFQDVPAAVVDQVLNRVEAQGVEVVFVEPVARVVHHVSAHARGVRTVEVEPLAPWGAVAAAEPGAERGELVPLGAEVVVDDVEHHREAVPVAGVDQAAQPLRPPVARVRRVEADAVVAPVPRPGELGHRHQLDRGDAQRLEMRELLDRRLEGALGGEGADVELVEDVTLERQPGPAGVVPGERPGVHHARGPVHALRLPARDGVGARRTSIEHEEVVGARAHARDARGEDASFSPIERHRAADPGHQHVHRGGARRPDGKAHPARLHRRSQLEPPGDVRGPHQASRSASPGTGVEASAASARINPEAASRSARGREARADASAEAGSKAAPSRARRS